MLNILSREIERRGSNTIVFQCVDYYAKRLAETISYVKNDGKRYLSCEFYCGAITLQDLHSNRERGKTAFAKYQKLYQKHKIRQIRLFPPRRTFCGS